MPTKDGNHKSMVRLQKYIADCGVTSRRKAEELIQEGQVTVNGKRVLEMGFKVNAGKDAIKVKGKLIRNPTRHTYLLVNKPTGVLTTLNDPEGRPTVKDLLIGIRERVFPVGRLDYESEGLLLLTNDGELAQKIIHPDKKIKKVYLVKLSGKLEPKHLERLRTGITLAEGRTRVAHVERARTGDQYDWYKVVLFEGRNRQIQRLFAKLGFDTLKVKRIAMGRLSLGRLERGRYRILTREEAEMALKD